MTKSEFLETLERLGYTQTGFAELMGVTRGAIALWKDPVPKYASAYLELVEKVRAVARLTYP